MAKVHTDWESLRNEIEAWLEPQMVNRATAHLVANDLTVRIRGLRLPVPPSKWIPENLLPLVNAMAAGAAMGILSGRAG